MQIHNKSIEKQKNTEIANEKTEKQKKHINSKGFFENSLKPCKQQQNAKSTPKTHINSKGFFENNLKHM